MVIEIGDDIRGDAEAKPDRLCRRCSSDLSSVFPEIMVRREQLILDLGEGAKDLDPDFRLLSVSYRGFSGCGCQNATLLPGAARSPTKTLIP